jgi:hypothetical protein
MFIVGNTYIIKMDAGDGSGGSIEHYNCKVMEADGTLVKFTHAGKEIIVNTASNKFVSAELLEP